MTPAAGDAVLAMLLVLFEQLRAAGVGVSMSEVLDAADALRHLDLLDRALLREALAASLVKRHQDRPLFDELFDRCFGLAAPAVAASPLAVAAPGSEPGTGGLGSTPPGARRPRRRAARRRPRRRSAPSCCR